jgi:hypothetical protein
MSTARLTAVPIDHIIAELAAFPLASAATLRLHCVCLDPALQGATAALWRQTENHLLGSYPGFSVDELVAMRDRIWFNDPLEVHRRTRQGVPAANSMDGKIPLHQYLRALARGHLEVHGDLAVPRLPPDDWSGRYDQRAPAAVARTAWRWLTLALPPDLLLAALGTVENGPHYVETLSPTLAQHLKEQGFAETHLHVGAGLDFPLLWNAVLRSIADFNVKPDVFTSPGAALGEGKDLAPWLVHAALVRYLLAAFLAVQQQFKDFRDYLCRGFCPWACSPLGPSSIAVLMRAVSELAYGQLHDAAAWFATLQGLYAQLTGVTATHIPQRVSQAVFADPIIPLLSRTGYKRRTPEVCLIASALQYLESHPGDLYFAHLFWQVVRVRALFYRHVVQRPMTPGLQWFVRFYMRASPARRPLNPRTLIESAAVLGGVGQGLRSLEFRTSPEASISAMEQYLGQIKDVAMAYRWNGHGHPAQIPREVPSNAAPTWAHPSGNGMTLSARPLPANVMGSATSHDHEEVEFGLVYHFVKRRGGGADTGTPRANWRNSHADPGSDDTAGIFNGSGYRYALFYRERRKEAVSLEWLLRRRPLALQVIRGLDVCTDELGVPNWVLMPILERVRQAASDGIQALQKLCGWSLPQLRTTAHSGEDFVHLLTGLRNVDQTIEYFRLCEGDRIGHGLALGVDPREWAQRAGRIPMMCEERLLDLVWEWGWYAEHGNSPGRGRHALLEHEIARLSHRIFGETLSPYELKLLQTDLGDLSMLDRCGFPDRPPPPAVLKSWYGTDGQPTQHRLPRLYHYLTDPGLFRRGRHILWVDPASEAETLAQLQAELRAKIGAMGIAVEVNPTSNLLIGDLSDLTRHPMWRLRPPRNDGDAPPVSICIGSDDPLIFGSNLRQEYQWLNDAMALAGLSDEEACQWLDRTRACGMESRFTLRGINLDAVLDVYNSDAPSQPMLM